MHTEHEHQHFAHQASTQNALRLVRGLFFFYFDKKKNKQPKWKLFRFIFAQLF